MTSRHDQPARNARRTISLLALGAMATLLLAGCSKPLFPRGGSRTQFDRYDTARNTLQPAYIEDEFGRRTPNLKGRLAPR